MTDLTKDEIVKMARECNLMDGLIPVQSQLERFTTLCRAPLVAENAALKQAHEINADTLNAMQVEIDDWKARALKAAEQEPTIAVPVVEMLVEALEKHHAEATRYSTAKNRANATCAEFKTSPLSELAEQGYMLSLGKETVAAIAAGQQYLKENGK